MVPRTSAGLLMYKENKGKLEFLLVHPGGPFFEKKDNEFWGIPKGEINEGEDLFEAAKREFEEEVGIKPEGKFISLGSIKQKGGKIVHAWAFEGNFNGPLETKSFFSLEWPPKSRKIQKFPEIDKAEFFNEDKTKLKIVPEQFELIQRLKEKLKI